MKIVGVLELASKYKYGTTSRGAPIYLFRPYDDAYPDYIVGCSERDTTRNQIALVDVAIPSPAASTEKRVFNPTPTLSLSPITCPGGQVFPKPLAEKRDKPRGNLIRLLGYVGDFEAEYHGLIQLYCPWRAPAAAAVATTPVSDPSRARIAADTGWRVFHVDPPGCRDIDDAIAIHAESGQLAITIADVAELVPQGSDIDRTAKQIGETFYDLNGRVVCPMLHPSISEEQGSLLPGSLRKGVTLIVDATTRQSIRWVLSEIIVAESYTYDTFPINEFGGHDAHQWIADLMILYNHEAAKCLRSTTDGILRVQSAADASAVAHWSAISPDLAHMGNEAAAYTYPTDVGHAGLGLDVYCHASSPLRRYADLHSQRILKHLLTGGTTLEPCHGPTLPTHLNDRTRANRRWSRDLLFMTHVTPGQRHTIDCVWVERDRVWVPAWKRIVRLRHEEERAPGEAGAIDIFCDPKKRNWRQRILTASVSTRGSELRVLQEKQ
jgi:exoribonuclease R